MIISSNSYFIKYTGRWNVGENEAVSTANGSCAEFSFSGSCAVIEFRTDDLITPPPHLYISADGGANIEVQTDKFIRICAEEGTHTVRIVLKGSVETQNRWYSPLQAAVSLKSIEADGFLPLPPDTRPIIEFLGDSITEGISIDVEPRYTRYGGNDDMVYWDDATAGYAWLTAKKLDMRPIIMGYGCLGTTRDGAGGIPNVCKSYPYYSDGCVADSGNADYIVINHGTNDRGATPEFFAESYTRLLEIVRERNPKSTIIVLTPFCGAWAGELKTITDNFNRKNGDNVFYINTDGWISPTPLHPNRAGHETVSRRLAEEIRKIMRITQIK